MSQNVADLIATLRLDTAQFNRSAQQAGHAVAAVADSADRSQSAIGRWAGMMKLAAAAAASLFVKQAIGAAVAAEEAGSAFATTFGPATQQASAFVEEFAHKAGFANYQLEQMLAVTGNVVQGLGATEQESLALSQRMATLAGDVASFSNASGGAQAVMLALQSAINGEREALKTYGLAVSEAEVQQKAFEMTGKTSVAELTRMDKALATVEVAYGKASKAVGDLDRTQDSHANTMRRVQASYEELKVTAGESLLPALDSLLPATENLIRSFGGLLETLGKIPGVVPAAGVALATLALGFGPVGAAIAGLTALALALDSPSTKLVQAQKAVTLFNAALNGLEEDLPAAARQLRNMGDFGKELAPRLEDAYWTMTRVREAALNVAGQFAFLNPQTVDLSENVVALAHSEEGLIGTTQGAGAAARSWAFAQQTAADTLNRVKARTDAARLAIQNMRSVQLESVNAVAAAVGAMDRYNASQAELIRIQTDAASSTDDVARAQLDLAVATLELQANLDALRYDPDALASAIRAIAVATGMADAEVRALLESLGILQGTRIPSIIQPSDSNPTFKPEAAGGPVFPGNPYVVGERGPELFMPATAGTIIPNNRLQANGGSTYAPTVHVHVAGSVVAEKELARIVEDQLIRTSRRGGTSEVF